MMRLAIVGSQEKWWPVGTYDQVLEIIQENLDWVNPDLVVSGGSDGVDTWAVQLAEETGIPIREYLPQGRTWEYFKDRNKQIAGDCDKLLCIRSKVAGTYGSGWTADYAEKLGVIVRRVVI